MTVGKDSLGKLIGIEQEQRITDLVRLFNPQSRIMTIRCRCGFSVIDDQDDAIIRIRQHRKDCGAPTPSRQFERRRKR